MLSYLIEWHCVDQHEHLCTTAPSPVTYDARELFKKEPNGLLWISVAENVGKWKRMEGDGVSKGVDQFHYNSLIESIPDNQKWRRSRLREPFIIGNNFTHRFKEKWKGERWGWRRDLEVILWCNFKTQVCSRKKWEGSAYTRMNFNSKDRTREYFILSRSLRMWVFIFLLLRNGGFRKNNIDDDSHQQYATPRVVICWYLLTASTTWISVIRRNSVYLSYPPFFLFNRGIECEKWKPVMKPSLTIT